MGNGQRVAKTFDEILESINQPATEEETINKTEEPQQFHIMKTDDEKRLIFGWASVAIKTDGEQVVDLQKDIIDPDDLEEAVYAYVLNFRDGGEEHIPNLRKKARMIESCMFTKEKMKAMGIPEGIVPEGWWIGFYVDDDDAWEKVKNGTYQMFSVEGQGVREEVDDEEEVKKNDSIDGSPTERPSVAKTFDEILKFNPYHDRLGRFATASGYASFTTTTKDPKKQHWADKAIARMKQQAAAAAPPKPNKNYDKLGYADHDDADYHQLYNGRQYYQQQKLTAQQKQAATNYLEAHPEPGSLYSHSQNMNYQMATGQKLTGKYKQTYDGIMSAMHNLGYNVELTRYDHDGMINGMLNAVGANGTIDTLSINQVKKALVGTTMNENKLLSVSYNDFKAAPSSSTSVFTNRRVKVTYRAQASTQAMMPGNGPGGNLGELILAPTNGKSNPGGKIVDIKLTGAKARNKGSQILNKQQIEIVVEI